jgi:hypothetical protein
VIDLVCRANKGSNSFANPTQNPEWRIAEFHSRAKLSLTAIKKINVTANNYGRSSDVNISVVGNTRWHILSALRVVSRLNGASIYAKKRQVKEDAHGKL